MELKNLVKNDWETKSLLLSIFYDVFICDSELNNDSDRSSMEKSFLNFIYWILLKSAECYYGDSMKSEIPYTPYF